MARNFSVILDNIGDAVQDGSATTRAIIKVYANRRYKQILRAINWNYINEDYTITIVAGTQDYTLPTDFRKELYVTDETNNKQLTKLTMEELVRDYVGTITDSGTIDRYVIFRSDSGDTKIRFHYKPASAGTVQVPYIVNPAELSADTDQAVIDVEDLIEVGATADTWRHLRQFSKARDFENLFTSMLHEFVWDEYNQPGKVYQFRPTVFNRNDLV